VDEPFKLSILEKTKIVQNGKRSFLTTSLVVKQGPIPLKLLGQHRRKWRCKGAFALNKFLLLDGINFLNSPAPHKKCNFDKDVFG